MPRVAAFAPALVVGPILALALALGCGEDRTTADDVEREMSEAADTTAAYLSDQKEVYRERIRERIDALDERIRDAEPGVAEELRESRAEARALLERVGDASREEWERVKGEVDDTLASIRKRYEEAAGGS